MFGWFPRHVDGRPGGDIRPNLRPKTRKIKNVSAAMVCCDAFCISNGNTGLVVTRSKPLLN